MDPSRWQQIAELYHAALEYEPGERAAFLVRACDGDADLRGEVESLLEQNSQDGALDRPAFEGAQSLLDPSVARITAGTLLGPYRVEGPLGAGGMGEVYRAKDTKLDREIAIKVLPSALATDPERLARFGREAKVLASLNHYNIAQIYGIEESSGIRALVMELVPGKTLHGPLPMATALDYARQIADALEAAHEKGIIHRDLKPANIMITPAGVVKVLDFGLAAMTQNSAASAVDPDNSPTLAMATQAGMIMGTAAYMSPEQAAGKPVDRRADIWSYGAVLWEMLTDRRLFGGETVSHTLANVLNSGIDFNQLPPKTPPAIRQLLRRCLDRDVKTRLQWIGEARIAIQNTGKDEEIIAAAPLPSRLGRLTGIAAAVLAVVAAGLGIIAYRATRPAELKPLIHLNVEIAPDTPLARVEAGGGGTNMLALSPDGMRMVLTLRGTDGKMRLHTRLLNQSQVTPVAGTENAYSPFLSPAGDWIGFFADGKLKKIAVEGGAAVTLCDAPRGSGASWGDDGNIIAALSSTGVLSRVPSSGGMPVPVTKLNPDERTHRFPQVLPGSQAVLFTSATQSGGRYDNANIDVISLKTGERKTIQRGGFSARYLADAIGSNGTGHLIYLHEATLFAVPFDPDRLASIGTPVPILEDVSSTTAAGGDFAFAQNGSFVYLSEKESREAWPISWVDSSGKTQPLHAPPGQYATPRFSPDGKRLAFSMNTVKGADIWVKDLDRDAPSRLSFLPGVNFVPVWTPDGKNIVFSSNNPAAPGLYGIRSDGSGEAQRLTEGKIQEIPYSFSPDGERLAFHQTENGGSADIFTVPVEVDAGRGVLRLGKAEPFVETPFRNVYPAFSPDGHWLGYTSNESGTFEVYVRPFPGPGGRWQVSTGGGSFPLWSRDGRELLFETPDSHVMAVSYAVSHTTGGDSFAAGKPRVWTETRLRRSSTFSNYDLAPDGKRLAAFVAEDTKDEKPITHLTFLLNFLDEVARKVPTGK